MSPFVAETRWTLALNNALVAPPAYDGSAGYFPIEGDRIAAYDLNHGTLLWLVSARPQSAPAAAGGLLFLELTDGLAALDATDGSVAWHVPLTEKLAVPLVSDNVRLVAATQTTVLVFRAADGTLLWRREFGMKPHASPSLAGDALYMSAADGRVMALRADNGETLWERQLREAPNDILVDGGYLFVGSNDNYLYCLTARDGTIEWRVRTGADVVSRPAVDERRVYFVSHDNILRALNRRNGVQQWKKALKFRPAWSPFNALDSVVVTGVVGPLLAFFRKEGTPGGEMVTAMDDLAGPPYAFDAPTTLGPMIVVATRSLAAGVTLTAVSRAIEPPFTLTVTGALFGLVPAPAPMLVPVPDEEPAPFPALPGFVPVPAPILPLPEKVPTPSPIPH